MRAGSTRKYFELPKATCDEIASRAALYQIPEWRVIEQAVFASKPTSIVEFFVNHTDARMMDGVFKANKRRAK